MSPGTVGGLVAGVIVGVIAIIALLGVIYLKSQNYRLTRKPDISSVEDNGELSRDRSQESRALRYPESTANVPPRSGRLESD